MIDIELPSFNLSGKTALVTGATSGFGRRFARVLAKAGARVALTGRRADRLEALSDEIEAHGGRALPIQMDVTDMEAVARTLETAETELGPLDILVNNAGVNVQALATDITPDSYNRIMDTNVKGAFFMATDCGRRMIARGQGGRIINIASIAANTVLPGLSVYCMSKAAIAMMTKSLAREWARHNINVNAMCPGFIETELNDEWFSSELGQKQIQGFPRRRLGVEQDLDGLLLLLASDHSRLITGSLFTIDDGQSLK